MPNNALQGAYSLLYNTQYKRLHTYLELYDLTRITRHHPQTASAIENIRGKIDALQIVSDTMQDNVETGNGGDLDSIKLDQHCLETVRFTNAHTTTIYYNSYADTMTEVLCAIRLLIVQHE